MTANDPSPNHLQLTRDGQLRHFLTLDGLGRAAGRPVPCHLKIETGTHRQGILPAEIPDFAELFGVGEKMGILRRARKSWGWRGVLSVFQREMEVHRLLTKERILGLNLLLGVKAGPAQDGTTKKGGALDGDFQAAGLPLFGDEADEGD